MNTIGRQAMSMDWHGRELARFVMLECGMTFAEWCLRGGRRAYVQDMTFAEWYLRGGRRACVRDREKR